MKLHLIELGRFDLLVVCGRSTSSLRSAAGALRSFPMVRLQGFNISFLLGCRFITLLIIATPLLQFMPVSAVDRHASATRIPGSQTDYYLRGKMDSAAQESQQPPLQHRLYLENRQLSEEASFEADSVEVEDYTPPCANSKHDPSVCRHN